MLLVAVQTVSVDLLFTFCTLIVIHTLLGLVANLTDRIAEFGYIILVIHTVVMSATLVANSTVLIGIGFSDIHLMWWEFAVAVCTSRIFLVLGVTAAAFT
jgi:hypothetical protein